MQPTERGLDLVRRLMLLDGKFKDSLEIYSRDSLWVSYFKGLCILPAEDATCLLYTSKRFAKNEQGSGFLETRLYRTDSIISSNLGNGYIGTMRNDTFGLRTAGYLTQYLPGVLPSDTAGFGYRPIFDSAVLVISVADYAGDTLTPVRYNVYEVTSNDYLLKDCLLYTSGSCPRAGSPRGAGGGVR